MATEAEAAALPNRKVWSAETSRGRIALAVEPADGTRWRYSILGHHGGRVEPISQGLSDGRTALAIDVDAALARVGIAARPAWLHP